MRQLNASLVDVIMPEICLNQVLQIAPDQGLAPGLFRVIWVDHQGEGVMVIATDQKKRSPPIRFERTTLQAALSDGKALPVNVKPDPHALMTDAQLTTLYPPRSPSPISFPVAYRTFWWSVISPIVSQSERYFLGLTSLSQLIRPRAVETGASRQRIYQVLYQFWAKGSTNAALLPNSTRCGGPGKPRASSSRVLGRRRLQNVLAGEPSNNYPLTAKDIDQLQFGWRSYLKPGINVKEAYGQTMRAFYVAEWVHSGNELQHRLKPVGERPSLKQFCYHGPNQMGGQQAWRMHLSQREYLLNHRPLDGLPNVGLRRIGAVGQADAATSDVHLVSAFDRSRIVGTCSHVLVVDEFTRLIVGFSVAWSVDTRVALLAVLNAASSKVDFCARYGITITEDDWPKAVFLKVLGDRGEFNSQASYDALAAIHCALELVQTGRGDGKGVVEGNNHVVHATVSHKLPGTTHGQHRKRGESEPALDACLDIHEYTAELIRAILHHNNIQPVPDLLTTEMLQDQVQPTRLAIWNWARQRGYVAYSNCPQDRLITALCSLMDAVVHADGIRLISQQSPSGADEILVMGLRYLGDVASRRCWLETARRRGTFRIQVYCNPYDLRQVWYLDPEFGLQVLSLVTNDVALGDRATLVDLLWAQTNVKVLTRDQEEIETQSRSNMALARETTVRNARDATVVAHACLPSTSSKRKRLSDRRQNRSEEVERSGKVSLPPMPAVEQQGNASDGQNPVVVTGGAEKSPASALPSWERWLTEGDLS